MHNYLNFYLPFKQQQLYGPVNYRGFRETGPCLLKWPPVGDGGGGGGGGRGVGFCIWKMGGWENMGWEGYLRQERKE